MVRGPHIVRDIVDARGGRLKLVDSQLGGLCVRISLAQPSHQA